MKFLSWFIVVGHPVCSFSLLYVVYKLLTVSQFTTAFSVFFVAVLMALATPIYYRYLIKGAR
jgi:hypothetical protein